MPYVNALHGEEALRLRALLSSVAGDVTNATWCVMEGRDGAAIELIEDAIFALAAVRSEITLHYDPGKYVRKAQLLKFVEHCNQKALTPESTPNKPKGGVQ